MLQNRLAQLREERANSDKGFTLIELLVVVVIIGILIAIAIPLYLNYENGAKSKGAESDTRAAVSAVEQCYADNNAYPGNIAAGAAGADVTMCLKADGVTPDQIVHLSNGDTLTYTAPAAGAGYIITVANADSGDSYTYDSSVGKVQKN